MGVYWSVEECRWVECPAALESQPEVEVQVPEQRPAVEEPELAPQS